MSVLEKNKIDSAYIEDDYLILEIVDELPFEDQMFHWQALQKKLKNYFSCIQSGQADEIFENKKLKKKIRIFFCYQYSDLFNKYLSKMSEIYKDYEIEFDWIYKQKNQK